MRLIQFENTQGERQVGVVEGPRVRVLNDTRSTRELALAAIRAQRSLQDEVARRGTEPGPDYAQLLGLAVGVIAPCDPARDAVDTQFEVRGFIAGDGAPEDPATGSLNAGVAQWLLSEGLAPECYVVSQGTAMGRAGRIRVERQGDEIWIGGVVAVCIEGRLQL